MSIQRKRLQDDDTDEEEGKATYPEVFAAMIIGNMNEEEVMNTFSLLADRLKQLKVERAGRGSPALKHTERTQ